MDNEKAIKVLKFLDDLGYLNDNDRKWFEKLINEPEVYKLWTDGEVMEISYAWNESTKYTFDAELNNLGFTVLDYAGIKYDLF